MTVVDTSVLVGLFDSTDAHHQEARRVMAEIGPFHVTSGVMAEFTTVLRRRLRRAGAEGDGGVRQAVASLRRLGGFRYVSDHDLDEVVRCWKEDPGLSFVDAWILERAEALGIDVLTFDEGLARNA